MSKSNPSQSIHLDDYWKECVASVCYESTFFHFLKKIADTKSISIYDYGETIGLSKSRICQLRNNGSRLGTKLLQKLLESGELDKTQKEQLLELEKTPAERMKLIARLKTENFPLLPESDLDSKVMKAGQLTPAGWKKNKEGSHLQFPTAVKLCFALHCSVNQAKELLSYSGFHWDEKWDNEFSHNFMHFVRLKLEKCCWDLQQVIYDYWVWKQHKAA